MQYSKCHAYFGKECNWLKYLLALLIPGLKLLVFTVVFIASSSKQNHKQTNYCVSAYCGRLGYDIL
jgi:hypothetical protein